MSGVVGVRRGWATVHAHGRAARRGLPRQVLRRVVQVALVLGALLALAALTHPGRVAIKNLLLQPDMFPNALVRPLLWVTSAPRHEEYSFEIPGSTIESDLYLPATPGQHGAIVLYTGAFGLRRDPAMVRLAEALARSGAVVAVPESTAFRGGGIRLEEVEGLLRLVGELRDRSGVDPDRIGLLGFSAGGAVVLLAAEDERGRDEIAFVNLFGSYYDARDIVLEVASREIAFDGRRAPWELSDITVWEFSQLVIDALPDERDRDIMVRAPLEHQPAALAQLDELSPDGRLALELFQRPAYERVDEIVNALPESSRAYLATISPSQRIDRLKARLYVMRDRSDKFIPFTHSRRLVAEAPPGTLQRYTETELFEHVMPDTQPNPLVFARDFPRLIHHFWLVGREFL